MKVAFTVALLATLALAYSVFLNDGAPCLFGAKECGTDGKTTLVSSGSCTGSCCSKAETMIAFSESDSCCSKSSCCSTQVACKDGECESSCSSGKSCCQKTEFVSTQDGECDSSCSSGKSCCMDKTQTVSKQDGECDSSCSSGKSCCMEKTQTVSKQDGECDSSCSGGKSCCSEKSEMVNMQDGQCEGKCPASCEAVSTDAACTECPVAAAMAKLPKMTFKVGEETTCCCSAAAELAEKSEAPIQYVVADQTYCCKNEAYAALVEKTETFVNNFLSPAKCEHSGQTSVAGKSFACCEAAGKQTELVVNAVKDIRVSYKVNDEAACCKEVAETLAKEQSAPIHFVVGEETTPCELSARMKVAHAKYAAAVKAIATAAVSAHAETTSTEAKEVSDAETVSKG